MAKYRVTYELRDTHTVTVEAENAEQAQQIVCSNCYKWHRSDVYDFLRVEELRERLQAGDKVTVRTEASERFGGYSGVVEHRFVFDEVVRVRIEYGGKRYGPFKFLEHELEKIGES